MLDLSSDIQKPSDSTLFVATIHQPTESPVFSGKNTHFGRLRERCTVFDMVFWTQDHHLQEEVKLIRVDQKIGIIDTLVHHGPSMLDVHRSL